MQAMIRIIFAISNGWVVSGRYRANVQMVARGDEVCHIMFIDYYPSHVFALQQFLQIPQRNPAGYRPLKSDGRLLQGVRMMAA